MLEEAWRRRLREIAVDLYKWDAYHTHRSDRSDAGWPDEVFCKPPRVVFVELKTEKGRISPAQRKWLRNLAACGQEVCVLRPSDLERAIRIFGPRGEPACLPDDF